MVELNKDTVLFKNIETQLYLRVWKNLNALKVDASGKKDDTCCQFKIHGTNVKFFLCIPNSKKKKKLHVHVNIFESYIIFFFMC